MYCFINLSPFDYFFAHWVLFFSFSVVWGFDEQTVKVLTKMQKQPGVGSGDSNHSNAEGFTKYQVLISSGIYDRKPSAPQQQVTQPAVANHEVRRYKVCVCITKVTVQWWCSNNPCLKIARFLVFFNKLFLILKFSFCYNNN